MKPRPCLQGSEKLPSKVVFADCLAAINQWGDFSEDRYPEVDITISPFIAFEQNYNYFSIKTYQTVFDKMEFVPNYE